MEQIRTSQNDVNLLMAELDELFDDDQDLATMFGPPKNPSAKRAITDRQLHALSREHLLMMIRDLEKELGQTKGELDHVLLAYQAGAMQKMRGIR